MQSRTAGAAGRRELAGGAEIATRTDRPAARRVDGELTGGAEGNRTPGLNSAIVALYQLSYSPANRQVYSCGIEFARPSIASMAIDDQPARDGFSAGRGQTGRRAAGRPRRRPRAARGPIREVAELAAAAGDEMIRDLPALAVEHRVEGCVHAVLEQRRGRRRRSSSIVSRSAVGRRPPITSSCATCSPASAPCSTRPASRGWCSRGRC